MIELTANAVNYLRASAADRTAGSPTLRIDVERGGCAGLQYIMGFDAGREGDVCVARDGVEVFVSPEAERLMEGSVIDYQNGLTGTGFRIRNPNAVRSCGCGTSFEAA